MKIRFALTFCVLLAPMAAMAQFTGPSVTGQESTVEQAQNASMGTYVTVTGAIVSHLREDYYTFRDSTAEIRVEIDDDVWRNRKIGPEVRVRLVAEVDRSLVGTKYLWVKSLELVD